MTSSSRLTRGKNNAPQTLYQRDSQQTSSAQAAILQPP
jgi:hypothetical protein